MAVHYEWDVETVEVEHGNPDVQVVDHYHCETFKEALIQSLKGEPLQGLRYDIVLVRDDDDDRSWAYFDVKTGTIPEYSCDAYNQNAFKIPKRFHAEVKKMTDMLMAVVKQYNENKLTA